MIIGSDFTEVVVCFPPRSGQENDTPGFAKTLVCSMILKALLTQRHGAWRESGTLPFAIVSCAPNQVAVAGASEIVSSKTQILLLPCSTVVNHDLNRASFPTIVFRDVRMTRAGGGDVQGASPRNLWSALSLSTINDMLRKPLTEEEVRFNQVCDLCAFLPSRASCATVETANGT